MLPASISIMMALSLRTSLRRAALALGLFVGLAWNVNAAVSLGIDELEKTNFAVLQGKRVGLVNPEEGLNGLDHARLLDEFNAVTLAVCSELNLSCFDLAHDVAFAPGDFYDHVHNSPAGAEKIGRWLSDRLAPML